MYNEPAHMKQGENLTKMKHQSFHKIYVPAHEIWVPVAYVQEHPLNTQANLSVTSHINCIVACCLINVVYLTACHDDVALFE